MANIPLLGSKISLISKSEIRYEGVLYTVDTKESTVALAKVRSFGTEDRPTERPVAPRDEIYEYIIFRASDIKDLHVCESPTHPYSLTYDPAIVKHSQPVAYSSTYSQAYGCGIPSFPHVPSQPSYAIPHILTSGHYSGSSRSSVPVQKKSLTSDAGVQVSAYHLRSNDSDRSNRSDTREPLRPRNRESNQSSGQNRRRQSSQTRQQSNRRNAPRQRGRRNSGPPTIERFENEYDFEQANAEFLELENKILKNTLDDSNTESTSNLDDTPGAYNKDKSFFDDISCEATERSKGLPRFDWRYEQKLNVETFGVSANNNWLRRRRARGAYRRGFRGRGNFSRQSEAAPAQKTVTFDDTPSVKEVEIVTLEEKPEPIPVIEVIAEEKKDWPETSSKQEVWQSP